MKNELNRFFSFGRSNAAFLTAAAVFLVLAALMPSVAFAAEGSEIFKAAAVGIVDKVLPGSFGALLAIVAGVLALVAAATGSYRGAWALVFVCLACGLARNVVTILFDL